MIVLKRYSVEVLNNQEMSDADYNFLNRLEKVTPRHQRLYSQTEMREAYESIFGPLFTHDFYTMHRNTIHKAYSEALKSWLQFTKVFSNSGKFISCKYI